MSAVHQRFTQEMVRRLDSRLVNAVGETLVVGPDVTLQLGSSTSSVSRADRIIDINPGFDSVVLIAQLWNADIKSVISQLGSQTRLFFVEPTAAFGLAQRAQRVMRSRWIASYGLSFSTDVPAALRAAGITPTSVDRFQVDKPVFTFVAGEARFYR